MKILFTFFFLFLLHYLLPCSNIYSQFRTTGSLQNYNAVQTAEDQEFVAGRNRVNLNLEMATGAFDITLQGDLIHRYAGEGDETELLFREAYFDRYFEQTDLRAGKQVVQWGRASGAFVTDILSPVDLREFLTLNPSDLRIGVTALNLRRYFGENSLQLIFNPVLERDRIPDSDSRWFPIEPVNTPVNLQFISPREQPTLTRMQGALQYSVRSLTSLDLDLMALYWAHPMPAYGLYPELFSFPDPPQVTLKESYRPSLMAGYSTEWSLHSRFRLISESLFVHERLFTFLPVSVSELEQALEDPLLALQLLQQFAPRDDGYLLRKPWLHKMVGADTDLYSTNISLQFHLETILNYEERILPQRFFPYATLLLNRSFLRERLQLLSVNRYNFYAKDFWVQFQGVYEAADGIELAAGANLFGGEEITPFYGHFTFHRYRQNSFIFTRLTLFF